MPVAAGGAVPSAVARHSAAGPNHPALRAVTPSPTQVPTPAPAAHSALRGVPKPLPATETAAVEECTSVVIGIVQGTSSTSGHHVDRPSP